jgi:membrane associated rhomboid family serine protease
LPRRIARLNHEGQRRNGFVRTSEPIFNVPTVVTATIAALALVHGVREFILTPEQDDLVLRLFAFVPQRYGSSPLAHQGLPGGIWADAWTFVTYAFLHGSWLHLGLNGVWLLAFGTPVARRFGALRFLAFFALTAAAGAAAHLIVYLGEPVPVVGASAAISGFMAAAMRFAFGGRGPLIARDAEAYRRPALPLSGVLRNGRVLAFLVVWFGLNLLFGLGSLGLDGSDQTTAWQAHIGGFLAGLFAFSAFDPVKAAPAGEQPSVN